MCAKNHLAIFSSFLDICENVEWPRFFWTTLYINISHWQTFKHRQTDWVLSAVITTIAYQTWDSNALYRPTDGKMIYNMYLNKILKSA